MPDPQRTYRRFFQFRLSTLLVLVAILSWAMAFGHIEIEHGGSAFVIPADPPSFWHTWIRSDWRIVFSIVCPNGAVDGYVIIFNGAVLIAGLALLAVPAWKAFWLIRERRRERAATHC
jgi:hypothetical protein